MMRNPRRFLSVAVASVLAPLPLASPALAQQHPANADRAPGEPYIAVVTADDVYLRCGSADSYYPFGKVNKGDLVKVVAEKFNWARVLTVGPTFKDCFGYIRYPKNDAGRFRLEAEGAKGRTLGRTDVLAPNLNTGFNPRDSWKSILPLKADVELTVLETIEEEQEIVHKIALPENAVAWINASFLEPASGEQIAAWSAAASPTDQPQIAARGDDEAKPAGQPPAEPSSVLAREEQTVPPVGRQPAQPPDDAQTPTDRADLSETSTRDESSPAGGDQAGPPPSTPPAAPETPAETHKATLDDLEAAYQELRAQPTDSAEVLPLRQLYLDLADAAAETPGISRYAAARAEQLAIWAELQHRRAEIAKLRRRLELGAEETHAVRLAFDTTADYAAVGRLAVSTIYDGQRLPKLYRLQETGTGRTVAYLRPDEGFDLPGMLGQLVGIVGAKSFDEGLRLNLVQPRRIDLLTPEG